MDRAFLPVRNFINVHGIGGASDIIDRAFSRVEAGRNQIKRWLLKSPKTEREETPSFDE